MGKLLQAPSDRHNWKTCAIERKTVLGEPRGSVRQNEPVNVAHFDFVLRLYCRSVQSAVIAHRGALVDEQVGPVLFRRFACSLKNGILKKPVGMDENANNHS